MPKIDAPTVAEHHARRRRALLDAARSLLASTGRVPTMGELGEKAGLARSSVYQYFESTEALLEAVVADVLPDWSNQVATKVRAETDPGRQIWAYIEANIDLFATSEQTVAQVLVRAVSPDVLAEPMQQFHAQLQIPLHEALTSFGEPEVPVVAEMIDAMIIQASRVSHEGNAACDSPAEQRGVALDRMRRLLGGYLGL